MRLATWVDRMRSFGNERRVTREIFRWYGGKKRYTELCVKLLFFLLACVVD